MAAFRQCLFPFAVDIAAFESSSIYAVRRTVSSLGVLAVARGVELVTAIAFRFADMEFGAAAGAALVPGAQSHRIGGFRLRFATFGGLDAAHAAAVSLLLRALRMDSTL
jgi:hypothetical protein